MAKNKSTVTNNIDSVNLQIDYDKLSVAIADAIELERKREEKNFKNKKLSKLSIITIIVFILATLVALAYAIYCFCTTDLRTGLKPLMIAIIYALTTVVAFWVGKTKDNNFIISLISLLIAFSSFVFAEF